jgi:endonuclease YncB( thermonuclease family)
MESPPLTAPLPGYATPAKVLRVIDGDTIEVEITKRVVVRMLDCWAPEMKGLGKAAGQAAKDHLRAIVDGREITLEVPTEANGELAGLFTFGRVLGRIWLSGQNVSGMMVAAGKALKTKTG